MAPWALRIAVAAVVLASLSLPGAPAITAATAATAAMRPASECSLCEAVAADLSAFAQNGSDIAAAIAALKHDCAHRYANGTAQRTTCDKIATTLVDLLPWAYKELSSLAWDSANICNVADLCTVPCCPTATAPEQVHIALTRDPAVVSVMWTTLDNTSTHIVRWGADPAHLNHSSSGGARPGFSRTYTHFGWRGHLHTAFITGLAPGEEVFYVVGDVAGGFSAPVSFNTLPANAGTVARPLRIASVGDMGYGNSSNATVARLAAMVEAGELDMVLHNGDISYADGEYSHWDVFMRKIAPIAARVPYHVTPGNVRPVAGTWSPVHFPPPYRGGFRPCASG